MKQLVTFFWHRRDLRIEDNHGLFRALSESDNVVPVFIFDTNILSRLRAKDDQRVSFIHHYLTALKVKYKKLGVELLVKVGEPLQIWKSLCEEFKVQSVYCNRDYEPYALQRDKSVYDGLKERGIDFFGFKDHVVFEKAEVVKDDGLPYTVFTPYSKKWKSLLTMEMLRDFPVEQYLENFKKDFPEQQIPSLQEIGFEQSKKAFPGLSVDQKILNNYHETRDIPSLNGTSQLSVHLRFGTISTRKLTKIALETNEKYLNELIWREFYQMILFHFPHTTERAFKPAYDRIEWVNDEQQFEKWCEGKTGYPMVDAGMRELNATGWMHNRTRMVVASFLVKHLLIDWRWGEAYFKEKLLDYECASNVGGWQWATGSGNDAAPYFRVFNPTSQQEKFDPDLHYIRKWIPEYGTKNYPPPIVEHTFARDRVLAVFKKALQ